jgi:hypothetical protein
MLDEMRRSWPDFWSGTTCDTAGAREQVTTLGSRPQLYIIMAAVALIKMYATALELSIWSPVPNL